MQLTCRDNDSFARQHDDLCTLRDRPSDRGSTPPAICPDMLSCVTATCRSLVATRAVLPCSRPAILFGTAVAAKITQ